jgi:hypothetical protein
VRTSTLRPCVVVLLFSAIVGCGQGASQQAANQQLLEDALNKIAIAEQGFIPDDLVDSVDNDKHRFRHKAIDDALGDLAKVIANGSSTQKLTAYRLQALIDLSAARYQTRLALTHAAGVGAQSASMLRSMIAAQQAATHSQLLDQDQSAALLIAAYQDVLQQQTLKRQALEEKVAGRTERLTAVNEKVQKHQNQAHVHAQQAKAIHDQAFILEGDQHYILLDQAAATTRKAQKASAQADKHTAVADKVAVQLAIYQAAAESSDQVIVSVQDSVGQATQRDQQTQQAQADAASHRDEALNNLFADFEQINQAYQNDVDKALDAAGQRAENAIKSLQQGLTLARSNASAKQEVQFDLLAAMNDQLHLLTEHAFAATNHARAIGMLALQTESLFSDTDAGEVTNAATQTAGKQQALLAQAQQILTAGQALAAQLTNQVRGQNFKDQIATMTMTLSDYQTRLSSDTLKLR